MPHPVHPYRPAPCSPSRQNALPPGMYPPTCERRGARVPLLQCSPAARRSGGQGAGPMKAIVIEDRGTFGPALVRQLEPLGVQARWIPHPVAADLAPATWASVPLVLLDALDLSSQQDDRSRSRLTSLDVLESVARVPPPDTPL